MGIEENLAKISQMSVARQNRFYKDNTALDAKLMSMFQELDLGADDDEDDDENKDDDGGTDHATVSGNGGEPIGPTQ